MTILKTPAIWPPSSYIRPIKAEHGGQRAYTHFAELRDPDGKPCRGYVKHFPANFHRALFNEWFGYTVLSSLGVPQPACAIMQAPVLNDPAGIVAWAFVSCEPRPAFEGTPKELYNSKDAEQLKALTRRLFNCPSLPLMIAADQLLMNDDRNLGNLVFTSKSAFVAIDHADILGGASWVDNPLLKPTNWATSKLIEKLVDINDLSPNLKSSLVASAEIVQESFYLMQTDLKAALECSANGESSIAMDAVWWRCAEISQWFKLRLQFVV